MMKKLSSLCVALFSLTTLLSASALVWETDYTKALDEGQKLRKPILLFFNGSDWSGWGMKIKKEILSTPAFAEKLGDKFLCVEVDFPIHAPIESDLMRQNQMLKEKWGIEDYPRLVLIDGHERQIARLGYSGEGIEKLAQELLSALEQDEVLNLKLLNIDKLSSVELEECYRIAQDLQRLSDCGSLLETGLKSPSPLFFQLEKYRLLSEEGRSACDEARALRKKLLEVDPKRRTAVSFTLALIDFQELSSAGAPRKEVVRPLEEYLAAYGGVDRDNAWRIEMILAGYYLECDECTMALKHAETALRAAPDAQREQIAHSVDYIKNQMTHTASK